MVPSHLIKNILQQYALSPNGTHGLSHWARVLENGRVLAPRTGAKIHVVELFAIFHDSRRVNEGSDEAHGERGAELAARLRGAGFHLEDRDFDLLQQACREHTSGFITGDITVQTCWDADRLDLGRVGIAPDIRYLCTEPARDSAIIAWAERRSRGRMIPSLIRQEWAQFVEEGE
jgi:uncharacterized protein